MMTRRLASRVAQLTPLEPRQLFAAIAWTGGSGFWDDAANWDLGRAPVFGDDVTINRPGNITVTIRNLNERANTITSSETLAMTTGGAIYVDNAGSVAALTVSGGEFATGQGAMTIAGAFNWTGGAVRSSGTGSYVLNGTSTVSGDMTLAGHLILNTTLTHAGTGLMTIENGNGKITISEGAVYNITDGADFNVLGFGTALTITGTLRKSGSGESIYDNNTTGSVTLNGGTVDVQGGTLQLLELSGNSTAGGTLNAASGATLLFNAFNASWEGTYTGSGAGRVEFAGGFLYSLGAGLTFDFAPGLFHWTGGNWQASVPFINAGDLQISGAGGKHLAAVGFSNTGTMTMTGTGALDNAYIENTQSALFVMGEGTSYTGGRFNNSGTLRKTGAGEATFDANSQVNHLGGTVDVQGGTLSTLGSGSSTGGTFNVTTGAVFNLTGDNAFDIRGAYTGSGGGKVLMDSGQLRANSGTEAAILNFPDGLLVIVGGYIESNVSSPWTNNGFVTFGPEGAASFAGTFFNNGTIRHAGTFATNGNTMNNNAGATYEVTGDALLAWGEFHNFGAFRKSGSGTAHSDDNNQNFIQEETGTVQVTGGNLRLWRSQFLGDNPFDISAGAVLEFGGQNNEFRPGTYTSTGTGIVRFNGIINGPSGEGVEFAVFNFTGDVLQIAGGQLNWHLEFAGQTNFVADTDVFSRADGEFRNTGTWIHSGGGSLLPYLTNTIVNSGLWDFTSDGGLNMSGVHGYENTNVFFRNTSTGILRKSGGSGATKFTDTAEFGYMSFDNQGLVEVLSGTLQLPENTTNITREEVSQAPIALTGGTWKVGSLATLEIFGSRLTFTDNNPAFGLNAANVILDGPGATFTQINSITTNSGSLVVTNGRDFTAAGDLRNTGTLGSGPGSTLTIPGTLDSRSGTLQFTLNGPPEDGGGKIVSTGAATLGGTAALVLADGFGPAQGDTYELATFPSHTGDFATVTGLDPYFASTITNTNFSVSATTGVSPADLQAQGGSAIVVPGSGALGAAVNISYSVLNASDRNLGGSWIDSLYLSTDTTYDASDVLLSRVTHTGGVAANTAYTQQASAALPSIGAGSYYVLLLADSRGTVSDSNRTNNAASSADRITVSVNTVAFNSTASGTIADGQDLFYQLTVPPGGGDVEFDIDFAGQFQGEFYVNYLTPPTRSDFDFTASDLAQASRTLTLPTPVAGTYYILVHGREGAGGGANFSFTARRVGLAVRSIEPSGGSNLGSVSGTIDGSLFTPGTVVELLSNGSLVATASTDYINPNKLNTTFNLSGVAPGAYDLKVTTTGGSTTVPGGFTVNAGEVGRVDVRISSPGNIRAGLKYKARVDYRNVGQTDVVAPLIHVQASNANLRLLSQDNFVGNQLMMLGTSSEGPAGVLAPGAGGSITIEFIPAGSTGFTVSALTNPNATVDWNQLRDEFKPEGVTQTAWNQIFANFVSEVGGTWGGFQRRLAQEATNQGTTGYATPDVGRLFGAVLNEADGYGAISARSVDGVMGFGSPDALAGRIYIDSDGNAIVRFNNMDRPFTLLADNSYLGRPGDLAVLTKTGGAYTLREDTGITYGFNTDGSLGYIDEIDGRRTALGYTDGKLATVTDHNGDVTSYAYNPAGKLSTFTYPDGRALSFEYNADGRMTKITDPSGAFNVNYVSSPGAANDGAISSITTDAGPLAAFEYDSKGRVSHVTRDGDADAVDYSYQQNGFVAVTNPIGQTLRMAVGANGQLEPYSDAVKAIANDDKGTVDTIDEAGNRWQYTYDDLGNAIALRDPNGNVTAATYDQTSNRLTSVTDQRGNRTLYTYGATGDLASITFPDNTTRSFTYDAQGRVLSATNRRGQTISYTYDGDGNAASVTKPDGTVLSLARTGNAISTATETSGSTSRQTSYTYDAQGHVLTQTDAAGRTLTFTYDDRGRRTGISGPDGIALGYTYDAGGNLATVTQAGSTVATYAYDALGRLTSITRADGSKTNYGYNSGNEMTSVANLTPDGSTVSQFTYTLGANTIITQMTTAEGTTTYTTDALGQLLSATLPSGRTLVYTYDAAGNRVQVTDNGVDTVYASNNLNQYTSAGGATFTYDADGNLATRTDGSGTTTFTYDSDNRLISAVNGGDSWTLRYNPAGKLEASTHNGVTTEYLYDATGRLLAEYEAGTLKARYVQGLGLIARDSGSAVAFYNFDRSGDTAELVASGGGTLNSYNYLPYGEALSSSETVDNPFQFVGQSGVMDVGQGLLLMGGRHYDPQLGRFVSPEPTDVNGNDPNLYRYAGNNPVMLVDPDGLSGLPPTLAPFSDALLEFAETAAVEIEQTIAATRPYASAVTKAGAAADPFIERLTKYGAESLERQAARIEQNLANVRKSFPELAKSLEQGLARAKETISDFRPVLEKIREGEAAAAKLGTKAVTKKVVQKAVEEVVEQGAKTVVVDAVEDATTRVVTRQVVKQGGKRLAARAIPVLGQLMIAWDVGYFIGWTARWIPGVDYVAEKAMTPLANWTISKQGDEIFGPRAREKFDEGWEIQGTSASGVVVSSDPNDITGPAGAGDGRFVTNDITFDYTIRYENKPEATAPAQIVTITQTLDADLDWNTFELGDITIGGETYPVPEGLKNYTTRLDLRATRGLFVDVDASLNLTTGAVRWTFTSIDPETGDLVADALAGFLPANVTSPQGEGSVAYSIQADAGLGTGVTADAVARIVFDNNAPIDTPLWTNTIDNAAPTGTVAALPGDSFSPVTLTFTGSDDAGGSGIYAYDLYVSENGGALTLAQSNITTSSTTFTGTAGVTYGFAVAAIDGVGLREATPTAVETTTTILQLPVGGAVLAADPNDSTKTRLVIGGTADKEKITLTLKKDGTVDVKIGKTNAGNFAPTGSIYVDAGDGDDTISLPKKLTLPATVLGGAGKDSITGAAGDDTLSGGDGNDKINGGEGNNTLTGGLGDDAITAGSGTNAVDGGDGNDKISLKNGANTVTGGIGNDAITTGAGNDTINAGDGDDKVSSGRGDDTVVAGAGNDKITTSTGNSVVLGGAGNDSLKTGKGNGILSGGDGVDSLSSSSGLDVLIGGAGADKLSAGSGDDILVADIADIENDTTQLRALLAQWLGGADYAARVVAVTQTGPVLLTAGTTTPDGVQDSLSPSGGVDLIVAEVTSSVPDRISGLKNDETVVDSVG